MERKPSSLPEDLLEKSLYICTMDTYMPEEDFSCRYGIQAIKMSDLFSFSELPPFTPMFDRTQATCSKLMKSEIEDDEHHVRQEIDFLESDFDDGVPCDMGVGVFRSQIVFAGGRRYPSRLYSNRVYALDIKRKQVIDVTAATGDDDYFRTIPFYFLQSPKGLPKLIEIKGKFYALDLLHQLAYRKSSPYYCFEVFDPNIGYWVSLRNPPPEIMEGYFHNDRLSYLVAGTKIFIANYQTPVYFFDVEGPTQKWEEVPVLYSTCLPEGLDQKRQLPIWDPIDLDLGDHRLVVYMIFERLHFFRFRLSKDTVFLHYVATIELNVEVQHLTCLTYLGAETICCVFTDPVIGLKLRGVIFTFKINFSRSAAAGSTLITPVISTDDPYFKIIYPSKSLGNSFSAETLGWRTFEYQFPQTAASTLRFSEVIGLAVLSLHHNGHAFCKVCGSHFPNTEAINKHLSANKSCEIEATLSCKSEFTGGMEAKKRSVSHLTPSEPYLDYKKIV